MAADALALTLNPLYSRLGLNHHRDIRLVNNIESKDGNISCKLSTANLDQGPQYVAISYTWGPSTEEEFNRGMSDKLTHPILCNDQTVLVTENLYNFFKRAADNTGLASKSMWIDILSINQRDVHERCVQVKMMASIFESAATVFVWLGEHDEDTINSFHLMRRLAGLAREDVEQLKRLTPKTLASRETLDLLAPYGNIMYWKFLVKFFQRRYFTRVWIIQEVTLGREREAICGRYKISWDDIAEVSKFLTITSWTRAIAPGGVLAVANSYPSYYQLPNLVEANRKGLTKGKNEKFLHSLIRARRFAAFDPRDKVYALLGIAKSSVEGKARFNPVYGKRSVAETYILAAIQILEDSDDLLVLAHAEGHIFRTIESLPSWVPDWSCPRNVGLGVTGYIRFDASKNLPRSLHIDEENKCLTVKGMRLDDIVLCAETKEEILLGKPFPRLLAILCALQRPYYTKESEQSPLEVLWRSLITDTAGEDRSRPAASAYGHAFSAWFRPKLSELRHVIEEFLFSDATRVVSENSIFTSGGERLEAHIDVNDAKEYETVFAHTPHLRPFLTINKYFGVGSESLREKDSIWIIAGSRVPLVLREVDAEADRYQIVGGSYVHGFMSGEALELGYLFKNIVLL